MEDRTLHEYTIYESGKDSGKYAERQHADTNIVISEPNIYWQVFYTKKKERPVWFCATWESVKNG